MPATYRANRCRNRRGGRFLRCESRICHHATPMTTCYCCKCCKSPLFDTQKIAKDWRINGLGGQNLMTTCYCCMPDLRVGAFYYQGGNREFCNELRVARKSLKNQRCNTCNTCNNSIPAYFVAFQARGGKDCNTNPLSPPLGGRGFCCIPQPGKKLKTGHG